MSGFGAKVTSHCTKTVEGFDRFRRAVILSLFKGVIMDTPVDTGRLRANWQVSVGAPISGTVESQDKVGSVTVAAILPNIGKASDTVYLTNNLPYAFGIEFLGKSPEKAPQGMVRRNVARIKANIAKYARQSFPS